MREPFIHDIGQARKPAGLSGLAGFSCPDSGSFRTIGGRFSVLEQAHDGLSTVSR